jgi:hypothetical protein
MASPPALEGAIALRVDVLEALAAEKAAHARLSTEGETGRSPGREGRDERRHVTASDTISAHYARALCLHALCSTPCWSKQLGTTHEEFTEEFTEEGAMPHFTPDDIQRLMANPLYAISFHEALIGRAPVERASDWVVRNTTALETARGRGYCAQWLEHLLAVLRNDGAAADLCNPARAVRISETYGIEHPPLVTEDHWVRGNCNLIAQQGARAWLTTLMRVLGGDIVTAADVSASDPGVDNEG